MRTLESEIQIDAPPDVVWSVLTDFEHYAAWNPFITMVEGRVKQGEKLVVRVSPPRGKQMVFKPVVKSVKINAEFSWLGSFLSPALFAGEHIFTITANENGCRLVQKEHFSGLLVPLLWKSLDQETRAGFNLMNRALKQRAENPARPHLPEGAAA